MKIIVGMANMQVTNDPDTTLMTYLGSCIGIAIYEPLVKVGGILHYMLPDSKIDIQKAIDNPWMFADTGIPLFFKKAYQLGAEKRRIRVTVAGGSQIFDDSGFFNIGKRNYTALRKIFWMNNMLIQTEDIGGNVNRALSVELSSGRVQIKAMGERKKEAKGARFKETSVSDLLVSSSGGIQ